MFNLSECSRIIPWEFHEQSLRMCCLLQPMSAQQQQNSDISVLCRYLAPSLTLETVCRYSRLFSSLSETQWCHLKNKINNEIIREKNNEDKVRWALPRWGSRAGQPCLMSTGAMPWTFSSSFTGKPGWYGSFSSHQSVLNSLQSASFVVVEIFVF